MFVLDFLDLEFGKLFGGNVGLCSINASLFSGKFVLFCG